MEYVVNYFHVPKAGYIVYFYHPVLDHFGLSFKH